MGIEGKFAYDSFRPGQKDLALRVYETTLSGGTIVIEAMSGFGKTAAVLTGALSAAEETGCRVVYACRTKRQINRVVEEASRLQSKHPFKGASMLAKFDYCLLKKTRQVPQESFGWYCNFNVSNNLCHYFQNVSLAEEFDSLAESYLFSIPKHPELLRRAEAICVCPYEVARLAMTQAQVVVVPYHYAFDHKASSVLFDASTDKRKTILVVDEAHNLRDFFRGLSSASITIRHVNGAINEARAMLMDDAASSLETLSRTLTSLLEKNGWLLDRASVVDRFREERGSVWLQNLAFELSASSGAAWGSVYYERRLPSLILRVGEFLSKLTTLTDSVLVKWEDTFGLVDPEPVKDVEGWLSEFRSSVLLSATVNPSSVFVRSVGLDPGLVRVYSSSAEPLVTVRTCVDTGTSTRYKLRTPEMYARISDRIAAVVRSTETGVGIFTPSYSVLDPIFEMVSKRVPDRNMVSEAPGLSNDMAEAVFDSFRSATDSVLFAVQGGRFSEGEDFDGGAMGSVAVVGLALPPPSPMMHAEFACLKRAGEQDSFLMLSRLPALRKAFQAAGRHVRGPGKRGLVFFFDERFGSQAARELMPPWLAKDLFVGDLSPPSIESISQDFWANMADHFPLPESYLGSGDLVTLNPLYLRSV